MTEEQINTAIAEFCGWEFKQYEGGAGTIHFGWFDPNGGCQHWSNQTGEKDYPDCVFPDYCNDLNAIHEVKSKISSWKNKQRFMSYLCGCNYSPWIVDWEESWKISSSSAKQQSIAFLKTIGKYE